jgi:hypothetical protein
MDNHVLCTHTHLSPAVQRCCDARNRAIEANLAVTDYDGPDFPEDVNNMDPIEFAKFKIRSLQHVYSRCQHAAYLKAMPEPMGRRNIKDFIACVIHGMIIGVIERDEGKDLLYAARTASAATSKRKAPEKKLPATVPALAATEYDRYQEEVKKLQQNRI